MTDAQHTAHRASRETAAEVKRRITEIIEIWPGSTLDDIQKKYANLYNRTLPRTTASGRLSELANAGIIYVNGRRGGQSRYYYEPDPACRFAIREAREDEAFLRWARRGLKDYFDRIPGHVRPWLEGVERVSKTR